jgi:integrase
LIDSEDLSNLVKRMDNYRGNYITIQALQFLLLTAQRSYTVRAAKWENIDFENCIWDIPAEE